MKAGRAAKARLRLPLLLCLVAIVAATAKAQLQPHNFDVPDGKIERAAGNRLMVSTKEMRDTLKVPTQQNVTVRFTYLGPTKEVFPFS
jgi:hypothetical protein